MKYFLHPSGTLYRVRNRTVDVYLSVPNSTAEHREWKRSMLYNSVGLKKVATEITSAQAAKFIRVMKRFYVKRQPHGVHGILWHVLDREARSPSASEVERQTFTNRREAREYCGFRNSLKNMRDAIRAYVNNL